MPTDLNAPLQPYEQLRLYWAYTESDVRTVRSNPRDIEEVEQKYRVRLPGDFREYLLKASPKTANELDHNHTLWWSIANLKTISDEYPHAISNPAISQLADQYLFFADVMNWCSAWTINCGEGEARGRIVSINGGNDRVVADSFSQFVERYINDWRDIF